MNSSGFLFSPLLSLYHAFFLMPLNAFKSKVRAGSWGRGPEQVKKFPSPVFTHSPLTTRRCAPSLVPTPAAIAPLVFGRRPWGGLTFS